MKLTTARILVSMVVSMAIVHLGGVECQGFLKLRDVDVSWLRKIYDDKSDVTRFIMNSFLPGVDARQAWFAIGLNNQNQLVASGDTQLIHLQFNLLLNEQNKIKKEGSDVVVCANGTVRRYVLRGFSLKPVNPPGIGESSVSVDQTGLFTCIFDRYNTVNPQQVAYERTYLGVAYGASLPSLSGELATSSALVNISAVHVSKVLAPPTTTPLPLNAKGDHVEIFDDLATSSTVVPTTKESVQSPPIKDAPSLVQYFKMYLKTFF